MQIHENFSLLPFNTFRIDVKARYFSTFSNIDELSELIGQKSRLTTLILGGGSNILFTKDYAGVVLKNEIKGIELQHEDADHVYVKVGAGENWHHFVLHCINHNWAGVENLSLIPGNVGASPIQNIGAYGVELDDVFWSLEAFHLSERKIHTFTATDCEFGYRDSVFKNQFKNEFAILSVTFQLKKKPIYHISYGAITEELEKMGVKDLSIKAVSQAVINIRSSKLPDPQKIANAGSFFKNPEVTVSKYEELKSAFPNIVAYPLAKGNVKLAAGWMIEQAGWKGYRKGDAGCHAKQALVLVNYGNATGKEIYDLSEEILQSVKNKFGVALEREVNII
ncbi:MAG: UDP-N-acetylmuramate dehydrogenase [Bacteroidetes bacterium]|nr:MAG: UDP-N-acetylmuramate dehydrogenase [Bacteroidota bacterium]